MHQALSQLGVARVQVTVVLDVHCGDGETQPREELRSADELVLLLGFQ